MAWLIGGVVPLSVFLSSLIAAGSVIEEVSIDKEKKEVVINGKFPDKLPFAVPARPTCQMKKSITEENK